MKRVVLSAALQVKQALSPAQKLKLAIVTGMLASDLKASFRHCCPHVTQVRIKNVKPCRFSQ